METKITVLPSRRYDNPEQFVEDFLKTLTPGIIKRFEFIQWQTIEEKLRRLIPSIAFYKELSYKVKIGYNFVRELSDSLLACDDPLPLIECALELLGHTGHEFVSFQDDIELGRLAKDIAEGKEDKAEYFANLLKDLGFIHILFRNDLEDLLLGVQIGLETHRRKNIGGALFQQEVHNLLTNIVEELKKLNYPVELKYEITIPYGRGLSKKVDFAITYKERIRFGIEVNFYTVTGSKPTEIKRSYENVLNGLQRIGIDLIWITDGKGYRGMRRSLKDAYTILPNIYNLQQAKMNLLTDLKTIFAIETNSLS
jgi:hypothetical protein